MRSARGFTLIELIIVIVILGILSVTAAPKFLGLSDDAKNAVLKGYAGALETGTKVSNAKLIIMGLEKEHMVQSFDYPNEIIQGCDAINVCAFLRGYPIPHEDTIEALLDTTENAFAMIGNDRDTIKITFDDNVDDSGNMIRNQCYVQYHRDQITFEPPVITVINCK